MISVIVPVYNSKNYLCECISSIEAQDTDYEIILVDDGSTDGSSELCDEISFLNDRVLTIHIQNSGPFLARKMGFDNSKGELITFMDADDWLMPGAYDVLTDIYEEYSPDIIAFDYITTNGDISEQFFKDGLYHRREIQRSIIPIMMFDDSIAKRRINPSVCCKVFKRAIYERVTNNARERIDLGEDAVVTYPAMLNADSIYILHKKLYNYRIHDESATHIYPSSRIDEFEAFYRRIISLTDGYPDDYNMKFQCENYLRGFLEMLVNNRFNMGLMNYYYRFPYGFVEKEARIQIYGAGKVGKSYVHDIISSGYANLVGWYDINASQIGKLMGVSVLDPHEITQIESDKVLIANVDKSVVENIIKTLVELGVEKDKILWVSPIPNM